MIEWFLQRQLKILLFCGPACILLIALVGDYRWPQAIVVFLGSLLFVSISQILYRADTTENWLRLGYGDVLKNVLSGVFALFGWVLFLRGILALAIGAALLKMG